MIFKTQFIMFRNILINSPLYNCTLNYSKIITVNMKLQPLDSMKRYIYIYMYIFRCLLGDHRFRVLNVHIEQLVASTAGKGRPYFKVTWDGNKNIFTLKCAFSQ